MYLNMKKGSNYSIIIKFGYIEFLVNLIIDVKEKKVFTKS